MRGTFKERFFAHCRELRDHLIWTGGRQFRLGGKSSRRVAPAHAAYLLREAIETIPDGMIILRVCAQVGCVRHVDMFDPSTAGRMNSPGKLSDEEVAWIRELPDLRKLSPRARSQARRVILQTLDNRVSWHTVQMIRIPTSPRRPAIRPASRMPVNMLRDLIEGKELTWVAAS